MHKSPWCAFERALDLRAEDIELELRGQAALPWADFVLNPRRLRGSDFLMRWSQGVWSEKRLIQAINDTGQYLALPYGPSSVAPSDDARAFELYFERLEQAGLGAIKRPDLLVFAAADEGAVRETIRQATERVDVAFPDSAPDEADVRLLPFVPEQDANLRSLLSKAIVALECENSLWKARQMPDYGATLRPMARLGGAPGLPKGAVLPTVIIKDEDRTPLRRWQADNGVPIHVWQVFYDLAFGIALDAAERLIENGSIQPRAQVYQAPGGATTRKNTYNIYYHHAYAVGETEREPQLIADCIVDKNGHILPYVRFEGGSLRIDREALDALAAVRKDRLQ